MSEPEGREFGPLQGLRVIEMGQLLAGPFVGTRCADFGAEVIKIEPPGTGDPIRNWGRNQYQGKTLWWPIMARNKHSVSADLRHPRGQALVRKLIETADVLIENFKPGTLEKWDMSPERLHRINPGLVIVRVSGFGQTGPYASRPGFASVGEAMSGLRYINGYPDMPPPRFGISLGDTLTALFAFEGMMMALFRRDRNGGQGQVVDAAITESCFAMLESCVTEFSKTGHVRKPSGSGLAKIAPSNIYPTSDAGYVVIAANVDAMFRRLTRAMDRPELASDPKYATHIARGDNQQELDALIAEWSGALTMAELTRRLDRFDVVHGPINSIAEVVEDPHFRARGMVRDIEDDEFGSITVPGVFPVLSDTPGDIAWLGPQEIGASNAQVYGRLGLSESQLDELRAEGVI
ncbi:MAG: CaiB/BaiF CoA transferase family protein [Paracoccus sp. (in: a-proteobacteria)]|uniref:CaiB/BaiF CoA transferase family protein n=1 Tax=unclassified Paracoccus (in: a-proteobacteria) TaxID=2688777 RepID=UPI0025E8E0D7|nr:MULTISPECIES: CaiB/BaiF CoA-transferase family protein [unclassified Paracoccus (in: a-proteobacteria)]|tara:strand:+ start:5060 stop:6277 length:1218 start_codon:yes stop_codon:yes gene_type:complete